MTSAKFRQSLDILFGGSKISLLDNIFINDNVSDISESYISKHHNPLVICDANTKLFISQLKLANHQILILENGVKPHISTSEDIASKATQNNHDIIIAVGSGTINDLCKYASHISSKPYIVFPTAPSMNGYTSANASIIINGLVRSSVQAHLPSAIFVDRRIIESAPKRLINAGFGDMSCTSTCQFDWLLSHLLLDTKYDEKPFAALKSYQDDLSTSALMESLIISGFGMYICGGSYPASQGEHMIAHYLEMRYPELTNKLLHGELIAVTTNITSKLQDDFVKSDSLPKLETELPSDTFFSKFADEIQQKYSETNIQKINTVDKEKWRKIKQKLGEISITHQANLANLNKLGIPATPESIGLDAKLFEEARKYARYTRNRLTILDFA